MHDASKVLLGATRSNVRESSNHLGTVAAGLGCRLKSDGTVTTAASDGPEIGISLGKTLDNAGKRTVVCRAGLGVPVLLKSGETMTVGEQLGIDDTSGEAASIDTGVTGVNAYVVATGITGVKEDGTEADCVLVDFIGGL